MMKKRKTRNNIIVEKRKELAKQEKVAYIWTRVSSADQFKKNNSIETQLESCRDYCKKNQIRVKEELGGENESAKEAGELFLNMITKALSDPEINTIVVFDYDRFSRNSNDGIYYKSQIKKSGIDVVSVNQPIDKDNTIAEQIENILIIVADIDNATRRNKCREGMVNCINRGEWYSRVPLGYDSKKVDRHHVITVNEKGRILKKAFLWMVNEPEISQNEILRRLKVNGLTLSKQKLSTVLRNSFYCGRIEHKYLDLTGKNKPYIMGVQEPLITEEVFEKVQAILAGNHSMYEQKEETPKFPLKRLVLCAKDKHLLTGYTTKNKDYYKCAVKGCGTNVSAQELHDKFFQLLSRYRVNQEFTGLFKKVLEKKYQEREKLNVDEVKNIQKNLETLRTKLKKVKQRFALGEIEKDIYDEISKDMLLDIDSTEKELAQANIGFSNLSKYIDKSIEIASKLASYWRKMDFHLCQKIQHLAFPNGIIWDGEKRVFRTDGENEFLAKIAVADASINDFRKTEQDKSCDLSCLVAEAGLEPTTSGL